MTVVKNINSRVHTTNKFLLNDHLLLKLLELLIKIQIFLASLEPRIKLYNKSNRKKNYKSETQTHTVLISCVNRIKTNLIWSLVTLTLIKVLYLGLLKRIMWQEQNLVVRVQAPKFFLEQQILHMIEALKTMLFQFQKIIKI